MPVVAKEPESFRFFSNRLRMNRSCCVGSRFGRHRSIPTASSASVGPRSAQKIMAAWGLSILGA